MLATIWRTYSGSIMTTRSWPVGISRSTTGSGTVEPPSVAATDRSKTPSAVRGAFRRSGARNEISSRTRSMMVWRRRAPMFSVPSLTRKAKWAISARASGVNSSLRPSVSSSAMDCLVSDAFGSVRMRMKSSTVSEWSSTRTGKRPCSSGIRSDGLVTWNAPAAINRM